MTDTIELTIEIARELGWTRVGLAGNKLVGVSPNSTTGKLSEIPRWPHSLDEMAKLEDMFRFEPEEQERYQEILHDIVLRDGGYEASIQLIHASALQRARAFKQFIQYDNTQH